MKKILSVLCMLLFITLLGGTNLSTVRAAATVKSIEITKMPDKRAYNIGDGFTVQGLVVEATMSDGAKETVDKSQITYWSGVELTEGRAFTQEGWKAVKLTYKGAETSYGIAVFDPKKDYYITYDTDGGSKVERQKITASTEAYELPTPTKKGYVFQGWYHSNGNQYAKYEPGMGPSLEFKAKWGYKITFNANGGTGKMKSVVPDDDYTLPKSSFKKAGYKFVGWSTKKVADMNSFYEVGAPVYYFSTDKNVTLYAQWVKTKTYKISYTSVKGVKVPSNAIKKYTAGKTTELPHPTVSNPEKVFTGWKLTINGKSYGTFYSIPPYITGDIKLTPVLENWADVRG